MTIARRRPVPDSLFGGRLSGCFHLELTVADIDDTSEGMRTIRFSSPDLVDFRWAPGQDLMFEIPGAPGVRRRYTIRRADPVAGTADVEIVLHPEGRFAAWAESAVLGDVVEAIGPRGNVTLPSDARHVVMIGDSSARAVLFALTEALPAEASASVLLVDESGSLADVEPTCAATVTVASVNPKYLEHAIMRAAPSPDAVAYVYGEASLVRHAVAALAPHGVADERITSKAYWRRNTPNAAHGEPTRDEG